MADHHAPTDALGPNAWLVDEMYEQFLADPGSVSNSWQDFFADYQRDLDVTATVVDKALPATGRTSETGQVAAVRAEKAPSGATPAVGTQPSAAAPASGPMAPSRSPVNRCAALRPASWPTWRPASAFPPPPRSGRCPPVCSR
jgi:2-oxoglutarate decarboxylase